VVVVNEAAARVYWPQRDPIGQCLRLFRKTSPCSSVIGVVRDSHVRDVIEEPVLQLITPLGNDAVGLANGASNLIVRAKRGQTSIVEAMVRRELATTFGPTAVEYVTSVADVMASELRPWRVGLLLFGGFGVLALIVAALGTYSVLSYAVAQRVHEIGVRMALGAHGSQVIRLVVGQGFRLAALGVAIGVAVALAASRVMQSLLYDTSPREPMVALGVSALLIGIAAAASALPARRAARVDPAGVLRTD
jgi:ABC-type antimicrobial peptide transport system permease subunit